MVRKHSDPPARNSSDPIGMNTAINRTAAKFASATSGGGGGAERRSSAKIFDDPTTVRGYDSVPLLEIDILPRGGISFETKAVGRVQFGIPPETIKDSMVLGMEVPNVYIVPVERFCREMGPALGINLAEFEFPAYFNYFVRGKRCTLVVDSSDAERDIRSVFGETLLGPEVFRNHQYPCPNMDEDFDPSFPKDARPNFYKEFYNFRTAEKSTNYQELTISTLLDFVHFAPCKQADPSRSIRIGVPPYVEPNEGGDNFMMMRETSMRPLGQEQLISPSSRRISSLSTPVEAYRPRPEDLAKLKDLGVPDSAPARGRRHHRRNSESSGAASIHSDQGSQSQSISSQASINAQQTSMGSMEVVGSLENNARSSHHGGNDELRSPVSPRASSRRSSMPSLMKNIQESLLSPNRDSIVQFVEGRRDSLLSVNSELTGMTGVLSRSSKSRYSIRMSATGSSLCPYDFLGDDGDDLQENSWMYSQAKWLGEVATIFPTNATDEQRRENTGPRVEIFKMAGGTEYIVHDVDENNEIVGKLRFSGTVRVPDEFSVEGFISNEHPEDFDLTERTEDGDQHYAVQRMIRNSRPVAPTFHPPSFGVTVLGNSHGFDKNGSTSGYVLWVNGRGIMIDPPPYSSATLEREGIRPQMIMAIIITHCHADHDAGAFQKVMTGSRVAIITTPTIYKSFIRKYSALSGLRPSLLRHSHRHRAAIIGQPLRFQGATFHFTYTLHTIPCISFKVEWRGRSIVFTGDHMNIPTTISNLVEKGVLTKGRAEDLRRMPMQNCDILLHEAGAPPIHTPLSVLKELPEHVKERLYVVHTAAIPADSGLKVAPTGTSGTLRLDSSYNHRIGNALKQGTNGANSTAHVSKIPEDKECRRLDGTVAAMTAENLRDGAGQSLSVSGSQNPLVVDKLINHFDGTNGRARVAPLVFLRPTDVSDAWFILNLLSAVPFLSSLSYAHTMEFLEIAHVEMHCAGEVLVEGSRRPDVLCVFWEGTCVEREVTGAKNDHADQDDTEEDSFRPTVWHAGDWTGPVSLQPDTSRCAQASGFQGRDIIAISEEGVKVITLMMKDVQRILKSGSKLFRKYLALQNSQKESNDNNSPWNLADPGNYLSENQQQQDILLEVIECNSVLSNLSAMQKRYLESLAEGPRYFGAHSLLWKVGDTTDYAYLIVGGTATLGRRHVTRASHSKMNRRGSTGTISGVALGSIDEHGRGGDRQQFSPHPIQPVEADKLLQGVPPNSEYARLEAMLQLRAEDMESAEDDKDVRNSGLNSSRTEKRSPSNHLGRFANKVLARLYSRKAYTENLTFSRGNFLSDTSRMVSGDLANINKAPGMGSMRSSIGSTANDHHCHTSNLMAGPGGCVVMIFPKSTLVPFLDGNPGVLLCLLGSQVVV